MSSNIPCNVLPRDIDPFEAEEPLRACRWCYWPTDDPEGYCGACRMLMDSDPGEACGVATGAADERLVAP